MRRSVVLVELVAAVACSKDTAAPEPAPAPAQAAASWTCERLPFADSSPVPEASGAAWLTIDGALALVVVSDSGNHGAYAILDPDTGATREQGALPLGEGSDDVEGLAARGGLLYGLTSAGWMRVWNRDDARKAFELVGGPYAIGPVDPKLPHQGIAEKPPAGPGIACELARGNCGHDFEGLALVDPPAPPPAAGAACTGFAAAKADGKLMCLVERDGKLEVDATRTIALASPGALADAAFDAAGGLWAGANAFGLSAVWRIDGWQDVATARVTPIGAFGVGFPEVIAVRGDVVYRMSDAGGSPSLLAKFRCRPPAR